MSWAQWQDPLLVHWPGPLGTNLWTGVAGIVYDGRYLWVTDAGSSGSNFSVGPETKLVRIVNPDTVPPTLITSIDVSAYAPINAIRQVRLSSDGTKVFLCLKRWAGGAPFSGLTATITASAGTVTVSNISHFLYTGLVGGTITISGAASAVNNGTFKILSTPVTGSPASLTIQNPAGVTDANVGAIHWTVNQMPGLVLVLDKVTFAVLGVCQLTNGNIGTPSGYYSIGARDCVEDGAGNLWVTNSSQTTSNIVEKFVLSTVLANGVTPTLSAATVNCASHAEELCFDGRYIWTGGWAYTSSVTRIDPTNATASVCTDTANLTICGMKLFGGFLYAGDFGGGVLKIDRSRFVPGGINGMVVVNKQLASFGSNFIRNSFLLDKFGYLWVGNEKKTQFRLNPNTLEQVSSFIISTGNNGWTDIVLTQNHIWGTGRFGVTVSDFTPKLGRLRVDAPVQSAANVSPYASRPVWVGDAYNANLTKVEASTPSVPSTVTTVDLSAYGGAIKRIASDSNGFVHAGMFPLGGGGGSKPGPFPSTAPFVIVNKVTNAVVGVASVSTGGDQKRPMGFAFDGSSAGSGSIRGRVYVLGATQVFGSTYTNITIYKYIIRNITLAFPSVYATPTSKFVMPAWGPSGSHLESICYGAGYLWATTGSYLSPGKLVRIDPSTGVTTTYADVVSGGQYFACIFAHGSVWVSGASSTNANKIFRFNPATFPAAPISITVDPTNTVANTCEMVADDVSVWVSNGSNFVSALPYLYRVSAATNALIATVSVPAVNGTTQGLTWDGTTVWATLRFGTYPASRGVVGFSTGVGSEAYLGYYNPGGALHDPISMTF